MSSIKKSEERHHPQVEELMKAVESEYTQEKRREAEILDYINRKNYKQWVQQKAEENKRVE